MRGSGWVNIKYIYYYEQYTCAPWLTYLNAQPNCHFGIIGKIGSEGVCAVYEERRVG